MDAEDGDVRQKEALTLLQLKLLSFVLIWIFGFTGGLLPLKRSIPWLLSLGNCFSGGVFLGAGLIHMLAEAVEGMREIGPQYEKQAYIYFIVGILLPFAVERIVMSQIDTASLISGMGDKEGSKKGSTSMYLLLLMLGVHALIEGAALGVQNNHDDTRAILYAILAHKFFAGFALGVSVMKANLSTWRYLQLITLFALTTPSGILLGVFVSAGSLNGFWAVAMQSIAAGTFIYVALVEVITEEFSSDSGGHSHGHSHHDLESAKVTPGELLSEMWKKFISLIAGVVITAYFALISEH
jgi:zinc transporter 1/2/3